MFKKASLTFYSLSTGKVEKKRDFVAEDTPLHIFLNQIHYVTILCSPGQLKELAVGHLLSEGVLRSIDEIHEICIDADGKCRVRLRPDIDANRRTSISQPFSRLITSACGSPNSCSPSELVDGLHLPEIPLSLKVKATVILDSVKRLSSLAETFRKTGGVHVAALYSADGNLIECAEDVGRHNAVDKVIGAGALRKEDFKKCFLASSGRLSGDMVLKSARVGIPLIASVAAVISSGIEAAKAMGVTLIGFVRGDRMSIFVHPERVIFASNVPDS